MVKPQVRKPSPFLDDEMFVLDIESSPETSDKDPFQSNPFHNATQASQSGAITRNANLNGKKKWCRQEDTVKRKRSSVSMLGRFIIQCYTSVKTYVKPGHYQLHNTFL